MNAVDFEKFSQVNVSPTKPLKRGVTLENAP
jgi:hypothetical protein